jgi:hypothetical protein
MMMCSTSLTNGGFLGQIIFLSSSHLCKGSCLQALASSEILVSFMEECAKVTDTQEVQAERAMMPLAWAVADLLKGSRSLSLSLPPCFCFLAIVASYLFDNIESLQPYFKPLRFSNMGSKD